MSLPPLLISLLAGFSLATRLELTSPLLTGAAAALLLGLAAFLPRSWRLLPACAGMMLVALLLAELEQRPPTAANALHRFVGPEKVSVTGEVLALGRTSSGNLYYDLQLEQLVNRGLEVAAQGKLRLYLGAGEAPFALGDRLSFLTRLRRPRLFGTPGEFDYARFLARRDIFSLASVKRAEDVARLAVRREATMLETWRANNSAQIRAALPKRPELVGLVRALAQGERLDVGAPQRELLAASGLSHLFAISGLHFGLVAGALYLLGAWLWRRFPALLECCPPRRLLPLLLLPLLLVYLNFSGGAVSSWRAFLLLSAGALLMASLRRVCSLRALAAVALVLLLADPLLVYEAGFQLSFAATLGIILVMRRIYPHLQGLALLLRYPLMVALVTLAANLATLPFLLLHFQQFAPAGLLANLFAVPLVSCLLLPCALFGSLLSPLWPVAARSCFALCGDLLEMVLQGAEQLLSWSAMAARSWYPGPSELLLVGILTVCLLVWFGGYRRLLLPLGVTAALLLMPWGDPQAVAVTALSVGQGEALLLSFDGRSHVLIDAGGFAGSSFDVGERLVVPALARMGVKRLEAIILTHEHPDHMLGLPAVLAHVPTASLWTAVEEWKLPAAVRGRVDSGALDLRRPQVGWQTLVLDHGEVQIFSPGDARKANDRSLVVYALCGSQGTLLCGDLEAQGVTRLLAEPPPGPVTLLKLPHHGSRHSAQQALLSGLAPQVALVSAGSGNRYRLPHPETVRLYAQAQVPLWRTDLRGTLRLTTNGREWRVTRWKKGGFH